MKILRKLLVKLLGLKGYLKLVSKVYILLTNRGVFKKKYPELFYLDQLIQPDWICIDIGANLGYYSNRILRKIETGFLHAVEPIPLFAEIWKSNIRQSKHVQLHQLALGDIDQQVKMSIPIENGLVRHGLTKVDDGKNVETAALSFDVHMKRGDEVFAQLSKVDFIKIDVEGYEQYVLKSIEGLIERTKPLIQIELNGDENRLNSFTFLEKKGYHAFCLKNGERVSFSKKSLPSLAQDLYFVHESNQ
jgi:FkbM family methyltransferase